MKKISFFIFCAFWIFGFVHTSTVQALSTVDFNLEVKAGDLLKNNQFPEVFYVDSDMKLRWVVNEQAAIKYFGQTWAQLVKEFENLESSGLEFGESITESNFLSPVTEQETLNDYSDITTGWLVKNNQFAEVFYVDSDMKLRWVVNEQAAENFFGTNWVQQVKEFEDLTLAGLEFGDTYDSPENFSLDSDNDGLSNDDEAKYGTDPNNVDTDGDGVTDRDEINTFRTDPLNADTDGDGFDDGMEIRNGYSPIASFNPKVPAVNDSDYIRGDENAEITLIGYSDFQSPFSSIHVKTIDELLEKYLGKIRFINRHFPLSSIHPDAQKAAEAFECAGEQGKAYEMHDIMFKNQGALEEADLKNYAGQFGLNKSQFDSCLDEGRYMSKVNKQAQEAQTAGISNIPSTWVNDQLLRGAAPISTFEEIIDGLLQ